MFEYYYLNTRVLKKISYDFLSTTSIDVITQSQRKLVWYECKVNRIFELVRRMFFTYPFFRVTYLSFVYLSLFYPSTTPLSPYPSLYIFIQFGSPLLPRLVVRIPNTKIRKTCNCIFAMHKIVIDISKTLSKKT